MRLAAHSQDPIHLFEEVARQLFQQIIAPEDVGQAHREKIAVEGESLEHLMQEWVTALAALVSLQKMVFGRFKVTQLLTPESGPYSLQAEAVGELIDPHRHILKQQSLHLNARNIHLRKDATGYHAELLLQA